MTRINLPTEKKVGHLKLIRQGRQINLQEYNALSSSERLEMIRQAQGKKKYDLLLNACDVEQLVPQLHPQELYLTINELGAEYSSELLALATTEQVTTLLDLDCWNDDCLSATISLHWLALLLSTGEKKVCQLAEQIEPELLALFLKKHLTIHRGLEAYDDDDAENAKRLESLYDIEYASEDAAKIIGAFLQIMLQKSQETYLLLMEMVRSEIVSVLEEEVFQTRSNRLLDLGFESSMEARSIYSYIDPVKFVPGGKDNFLLETEDLQHPGALLARAEPKNLMAEVLSMGLGHELATELCLLANRKMSADKTDFTSSEAVHDSLQSIYNTLNLALEFPTDKDVEAAERIFSNTYLQQLFQLGHSLISKRQQHAATLQCSDIGPFLDYPEQLFIDSLRQQPAFLYREATGDAASQLQPISTRQELDFVDMRLQQLDELQLLFTKDFSFNLNDLPENTAEAATLANLFLTAVANHLLGRDFFPIPLNISDLHLLQASTISAGKLCSSFSSKLHDIIAERCKNCGFFIEFCLELWQEDLIEFSPTVPNAFELSGFLINDTIE